MIRGTTPTITYTFPFAVSGIVKFRMYFMQGTETLLTRTEEDCTFDGYTVSTVLTQEETYAFSAKKRLEIKCRFLKNDDTVDGTKSKFFDVEDTGGSVEVLAADEESEE